MPVTEGRSRRCRCSHQADVTQARGTRRSVAVSCSRHRSVPSRFASTRKKKPVRWQESPRARDDRGAELKARFCRRRLIRWSVHYFPIEIPLKDLVPQLRFIGNELTELRRRCHDDFSARLIKNTNDFGLRHRFLDGTVKLADDELRCPGRSE